MSKEDDVLEEGVMPVEHHEMYLSIAKKEYKEIVKSKNKIDTMIKSSSHDIIIYEDKDDDISVTSRDAAEQYIIPFEIDIDERCVVVIIFCSLTLEAFINSYGISNLSKVYFKKYIDRLSIQAKWVLIPKLIVRKDLEKEIDLLKRFEKLVEMRNNLTHYKTRYSSFDKKQKSTTLNYGIKEAEFSLCVVRDMIMKLHDIDERVRTSWLSW